MSEASNVTVGESPQVWRLTEVSRALTYARSLDEVLRLTLECAVDLLAAEKAVLMLKDEDGLLQVRAHRGIDPEAVERFRAPLDEKVLKRLQGLLGPEAEDRFLGVPLVVRGGVTGVLGVRRPEAGAVDPRQEWLLSALADQAAVALESARKEELSEQVESLRRQRSSKEHAIRLMSHDMRSPLNAIQGYLELLAAEVLGPLTEQQAETVSRVRAVARHLGALVERVTETAQVVGGEVELHPREVAVATVLGEAVDVVRPMAREAGHDLRMAVVAGARATVDPDRLRQVVVQLLENAVKYCPPGSGIDLRARGLEADTGRGVEIVVADDGPGIPLDKQERIFEPYVTVQPRESDDRGGFGLGLAIVRGLVERMGGSVALESGEGRGATFRIWLPIRPRDGDPD